MGGQVNPPTNQKHPAQAQSGACVGYFKVNEAIPMTDKRNYRVSGKKLSPKPYNLRRNQAKKLGQAFRRMKGK